RRLRAMEGVREGKRHRRIQGQDRERGLPRARANARRGQCRRHYRLFVLDVHNLLQKGIKPEDIKVMLMADHGLVLYGNAIMVNPDYAKANPQVVAGFVRATIKGVLDTVKDPDTAIRSVMTRNETGDPKIELERLKMSLRDNFVTPWVKANGFGGVDIARLAKSIDQIALTYEFKNRPTAQDIFTSQYLPPAAERKL